MSAAGVICISIDDDGAICICPDPGSGGTAEDVPGWGGNLCPASTVYNSAELSFSTSGMTNDMTAFNGMQVAAPWRQVCEWASDWYKVAGVWVDGYGAPPPAGWTHGASIGLITGSYVLVQFYDYDAVNVITANCAATPPQTGSDDYEFDSVVSIQGTLYTQAMISGLVVHVENT